MKFSLRKLFLISASVVFSVFLIFILFVLVPQQTEKIEKLHHEKNLSILKNISLQIYPDLSHLNFIRLRDSVKSLIEQDDIIFFSLRDSFNDEIIRFPEDADLVANGKKSQQKVEVKKKSGWIYSQNITQIHDEKSVVGNITIVFSTERFEKVRNDILKSLIGSVALMTLFYLLFVAFFIRYSLVSIERLVVSTSEVIYECLIKGHIKPVSFQTRIIEISRLQGSFNSLINEIGRAREKIKSNEIKIAIAGMLQMLAHDVRKPFSILKAGLNMIISSSTHSERDEIIEKLVPQVDQAMASVNSMIHDVMEIGAENTNLVTEPVSPETMIEATLGDIFKIRSKAEIYIEYHLTHEHLVLANSIKMLRVMSNIVDNAVQAMNFNGRLWFNTRDVEIEGKSFIEFCIGNSGTFITPEDIPVLFDAFFTKGKKSGTGLGLAIAQKIVNSHGGKIWCESSREKGTEFFFTLPIAKERRLKTEFQLPSSSKEIQDRFNLAVKTEEKHTSSQSANDPMLERNIQEWHQKYNHMINILLVDDESLYLDAIKSEITRRENIKDIIIVSTAKDSEEALNILKTKDIQAIICDIDLGSDSLNGYELVKEIRRQGSKAHICIHSNRNLPDDYKKSIEVGAQAFLPKPMSGTHLLKFIVAALENVSVNNISTQIKKPKVAVVDDDIFIQSAWKKKLKVDSEPIIFSGPTKFWMSLEKTPNLKNELEGIIVDYYFDESEKINGIEFAAELKEKGFTCPIILCSDGSFNGDELRDVDGVISKEPDPWNKIMLKIK